MNIDYFPILLVEINLISILLAGFLIFKSRYMMQYISGYKHLALAMLCVQISSITDLLTGLSMTGYLSLFPSLFFLCKCLYFWSLSFMGYFMLLFFERKHMTRRRFKIGYGMMSIPALAHGVLLLFNAKHGFFFHMLPDGSYARGQLFGLQYAVMYIYFVMAISRAVWYVFRYSNNVDGSYLRTLALFPLFPGLAGLIQWHYRFLPILCFCMPFAALLLYQNDLDGLIHEDSLTGLHNRRYFLNVLSRHMDNVQEAGRLTLFLLDVDDFKQINDTHGHVQGDRALVTLAKAMQEAGRGCHGELAFGRYGGDEFIVLLVSDSPAEGEAYQRRLEKTLEKLVSRNALSFPLKISVGMVRYHKSFRYVQDFVEAADRALYQVKDAHHKETGKRRRSQGSLPA